MSSTTATESLMELWNEWEIQVMVLLSFILQLFLFFTGSLRRQVTNKLLRLFIWLAYVGADFVAVYTLGLLTRHKDHYDESEPFGGTNPMASFWAPFLLIHLGGQDTITAFSIEDNNLWLRHLLNLVVQVSLALYVFWKSTIWYNLHLLIPAVFVFFTGIIKYMERTWALWCGSREGLSSFGTKDLTKKPPSENLNNLSIDSYALHTVPYVRGIFAGRTISQLGEKANDILVDYFQQYEQKYKLNVIQMELRMMYDALYTKSMVLRTWTGIIFRCVAQVSTVIVFVLFFVSDKQRYNRVNVVVTYILLIGGLFIEVCAAFMVMVSPWTLMFLKEREFDWLGRMSMSFFKIVQPKERRQWSNSMGQYNFKSSLVDGSELTAIITKIMKAVRLEKFWRNLQHTKHMEAKMKIMKCIVEWLNQSDKFKKLRLHAELRYMVHYPFEYVIYFLHVSTDSYIRNYLGEPKPKELQICEIISNYMFYLLAVQPSMLPVNSSAAQDLLHNEEYERNAAFDETLAQCSVEEVKEIWIRMLVYAAGKSRGEMHAEHLSKGGELLSFVWLLMAHHRLGDVAQRIEHRNEEIYPSYYDPEIKECSVEELKEI